VLKYIKEIAAHTVARFFLLDKADTICLRCVFVGNCYRSLHLANCYWRISRYFLTRWGTVSFSGSVGYCLEIWQNVSNSGSKRYFWTGRGIVRFSEISGVSWQDEKL